MTMKRKVTALITGASSGIGLELSRLFAKEGHSLVLVARRKEALDNLAGQLRQEYGVAVQVIAQDLAIPGAAQQLYDTVRQLGLSIDVLVNNAGFGTNGAFAERDLNGWQQMMQLNMVTLTELTHLLLPAMRAQHFGKVLNVASIVSFLPCPEFAVYGASKAYVLSFSEALRNEVRADGISVTAVCPGATATDFHRVAGNEGTIFTAIMDSPAMVARKAYRALWCGRGVIVTGWMNKPLPLLLRLIPRCLAVKVAGAMARTGH